MKVSDFIQGICEARSTDIFGFISRLKSHPDVDKVVDVWSQLDGFASLVRLKDGSALEVIVRPAEFAKHSGIQNKTKRKKK